jgi:hypothetical protein
VSASGAAKSTVIAGGFIGLGAEQVLGMLELATVDNDTDSVVFVCKPVTTWLRSVIST